MLVDFPNSCEQSENRRNAARILRAVRRWTRGHDRAVEVSIGDALWVWHAWRAGAFQRDVFYAKSPDNLLLVFHPNGDIIASDPISGLVVWVDQSPPLTVH